MATEINDALLEKWAEGFNAECEAHGVDPVELLKFAQQESLIERAKAIPERVGNTVTGLGKGIANTMRDTGAWWGNATANMHPIRAANRVGSSIDGAMRKGLGNVAQGIKGFSNRDPLGAAALGSSAFGTALAAGQGTLGTASAMPAVAGLGGYGLGRGLNYLSGGRIDNGMARLWQPLTDRLYGAK